MKILEQSSNLNLDEFMQRPLFAHLATSSEEGPRESPVWCLWQDNFLWICTDIKNDSFAKRIQADNRCAIGIVDFDSKTGKLHHVGFRGTAEIINFDIQIGEKIFSKYLGKDKSTWPEWFISFLQNENARLVKIIPETVVIRDLSYSFKQ